MSTPPSYLKPNGNRFIGAVPTMPTLGQTGIIGTVSEGVQSTLGDIMRQVVTVKSLTGRTTISLPSAAPISAATGSNATFGTESTDASLGTVFAMSQTAKAGIASGLAPRNAVRISSGVVTDSIIPTGAPQVAVASTTAVLSKTNPKIAQ